MRCSRLVASTLARSQRGVLSRPLAPQLLRPLAFRGGFTSSVQPRFFSAKATPETPMPKPAAEGEVEDGEGFKWRDWLTPSGIKANYKRNKQTLIGYAKIGGVCVLVYYVVKTGFNIGDFMASTSFYDVGTISFSAGIITSGVVAVILSYASRLFVVRPELVYKQLLRRLKTDPMVTEHLGRSINAGKFRAYNLSQGGPRVLAEKGKTTGDYEGWERFWKTRKLEMIFQLEGSKDKGMVSFEAQKSLNGKLRFNSIVLDCVKSGERVVLEGDGGIKVYQGKVQLR